MRQRDKDLMERMNRNRLLCLAALQKYPEGQIAKQLAKDTGLHPTLVGNLLRQLAEAGTIGRGYTLDLEHSNVVALWIPDPRAGCERIRRRPRPAPVPRAERLERQSFTDKALAKEHAEWIASLKKPRYNPWGNAT